MSATTSAFLFYMVVFLVAAWIAYALDRRWGKNWYRKWYNLCHEDKLPAETVRGFVCGRPGKTQCKMALLLAIMVTVGLATFVKDSSLTWFFTWVFGAFAVIVGFMTGPLVINLWGRREKVYSAIDDIESGKIKPVDSVKYAGKNLSSRFSGLFGRLSGFWSGPAPNSPTAPPVISPKPSTNNELEGLTDKFEINIPDLIEEPQRDSSESTTADDAVQHPKEMTPEEKIKQFTGG